MSEPSSSSPAGGQAAAKSSAGTGGLLLASIGWLAFLCGVAVFALVAFVRHEHEIEADRRYALAGEQRSVARAAATLAKNLAGGSIPAASPTSLASTSRPRRPPPAPPPPTPAFPRCAPARWSSSPAPPLNRTPVSRPNGRCRPSGLASPRGSTPFRANGRGSSISGRSSRRFGGRARHSGRARSGSPTPFPAAAGDARRGGGPDPRRATIRRSGRPGQPRGTGPPRPRAGAAGRPCGRCGEYLRRRWPGRLPSPPRKRDSLPPCKSGSRTSTHGSTPPRSNWTLPGDWPERSNRRRPRSGTLPRAARGCSSCCPVSRPAPGGNRKSSGLPSTRGSSGPRRSPSPDCSRSSGGASGSSGPRRPVSTRPGEKRRNRTGAPAASFSTSSGPSIPSTVAPRNGPRWTARTSKGACAKRRLPFPGSSRAVPSWRPPSFRPGNLSKSGSPRPAIRC